METTNKYIFDMDGTLYRFACGSPTFGGSVFCADLRERVTGFLADELTLPEEEAMVLLSQIDEEFDGELSLGIERRLGIDRYRYYEATWGCDPGNYVVEDTRLAGELQDFAGDSLLLTAAPRAWATRVLAHLGITDVFGDNIITGEPDLRKPDPDVFALAAEKLGATPSQITSIGDQNYSDIVPAKALGMKTIMIGPEILDADQRADTIIDAIRILKEITV